MKANEQRDRLGFDDLDDCRRMRDVFAAANYTETEIADLVPSSSGAAPLETLARLFYFHVPTDIAATRRALEPMALEEWVEAGLMMVSKDLVVPLVSVLPSHGLLLACDIPPKSQTDDNPDFVMGVGGSTRSLAMATIRRPVQRTLDLGTGCGIQALLAAAHSQQVVAVDRNSRALDFARFNAQLNGLTNIEFLAGDLFQPVEGQQFDLVVANPPFVISPQFRAHYRDNGMSSDQFCKKIVRQVPQFLREGGYCQIMCNWAHVAGRKWHDRLASWFGETGCDAWVMRTATRSLSEYTLDWNEGRNHQPGFSQLYQEWMAYYKQQRIEAISTGLITMRRTSGRPNWCCVGNAPEKITGEAGAVGEAIRRGFESHDFLLTVQEDPPLLNAQLTAAPNSSLLQLHQPSSQGWRQVGVRLQMSSGLCFSEDVDQHVAELVVGCDGKRTVGDLMVALAARRKVSVESIAPKILSGLRRLISCGFLAPVRDDNGEVNPLVRQTTTQVSEPLESVAAV